MEPTGIPGEHAGTALWFSPAGGGTLMSATVPGGHASVILRPGWLLPLAAWFAGESRPVRSGDGSFTVHGDESAEMLDGYLRVRLTCTRPFGPAQVTIGPLGEDRERVIKVSPGARGRVAALLRREASGGWTEPAVSRPVRWSA